MASDLASGVDFTGHGWSYPLGTTATGGIALCSGDQEIEESIWLVIGTAYGERPMRPEFGCAIHDLVFSPVDASFTGLIAYEVRESLARWEPRIEIVEVTATSDPGRDGVVLINLEYRVRSTNDRRNLVFPFYTIPSEE